MSVQNDTFSRAVPKSAKIPWEGNEEARFEKYLKKRGLKKGPFLRVLALREIETAEAIETGRTQIDIDSLTGDHVTQEELEAQS